MEFAVRRVIVTSISGVLGESLDNDMKQGKFWFRLSINGCNNVDQLYLYLMSIGLLDYQARKLCAALGESSNEQGEYLAEVFGIEEDGVMSFIVSAATDDELEEKTGLFIEGVEKMKEAALIYLLQKVPSWATKKKELFV
ncbi:MAG: hypothetical protein HXX11_24010 [Desulfuromonadales bacterium]|nr:hypothetical protein [Desulfuromonadales bacterium]